MIDAQDGSGRAAIHWAAATRQIDIIRALLDAHCQVNLTDSIGWTPLHCAASSGAEEVVEILIDAGAKLNARTDNGQVPLHYAASKNNTGELNVLFKVKDRGQFGSHYSNFQL